MVGKKDTEQDGSNFFPFAIYDEQQKTIDTNRPRLGRKGRARRKEVLEKSYVDSNSNSISEQNNDFEAITGDEVCIFAKNDHSFIKNTQ